MFSDISDVELDTIAQKSAVERYVKEKSIFKKGKIPKRIYLAERGKVEISENTFDGWKQTVTMLTKNRIFGELSIIEDKHAYGAEATAIEVTEVYLVKAGDFKEFAKIASCGTLHVSCAGLYML